MWTRVEDRVGDEVVIRVLMRVSVRLGFFNKGSGVLLRVITGILIKVGVSVRFRESVLMDFLLG